jgi:hypothetical protein
MVLLLATIAEAKTYTLNPDASTLWLTDEIGFVPLRLRVTRTRFRAEIGVENNSDEWVVIDVERLRCGIDRADRTFEFALFEIGERSLDLEPGEVKVTQPLRCEHWAGRGDLVIWIPVVLAGAQVNATELAPVAKDLEWRIHPEDLTRDRQREGVPLLVAAKPESRSTPAVP